MIFLNILVVSFITIAIVKTLESNEKHDGSTANKHRKLSTNNNVHMNTLNGKKVLIATTSYGTGQFLHLQDLVGSYRDLCECGAEVALVLYVTLPFSPETLNLLNSRTRCRHPNGNFDIKVIVQGAQLKEHFVDAHRKYFYDHLDEYDLFMYTEDDMNARPMHFVSYLDETEKLKELVGEKVSL